MPNNAFSMISFFYSVFLLIVYFAKPRIKTIESRIYRYLIIINSMITITVTICWYTIIHRETIPLINDFMSKIALVTYLAWVLLFLFYAYLITGNVDNDKLTKKQKTVGHICLLIFVILSILIAILPLNYYGENVTAYSFGPSANVVYGSAAIVIVLCVILSVKNIRNILNKRYYPIYLFIFLSMIAVVIQKQNPAMLLSTALVTFVTIIMYFTIENPDVKMLKLVEIERDRADKANQAKSDFLSSMSHEIRTPLNAIVGFSESLKEENLPPAAIEEVNDIIDASQTLLDTVNGILDISKIEANKIEIIESTYDFNKIFNELISLSKARLGDDKPIDFRYSIAPDVPQFLNGDYARVRQVVLNFLTNAIKYTKEGYIDFNVRCICNDGICRLIMTIEDSGIGIKKENIDKLFDKFERGENENSTIEGTGLGLAITKKLVEMMHGRIIVQSIYGKGSQFMVIIDQKIVDKGNVVVQNTTETLAITHDLSNKKILIVDDNKMNLKVAARLLKSYNVQITEALSGFECLDLIGGGNTFDLILMDDMMPKKNGKETFAELKSDPSFNIPVVILTANAISGMKEEYLALGFNDYLAKPIEKDELNRVIKEYLDK